MTCRQEVGQEYAPAEQEVASPKEEPAVHPCHTLGQRGNAESIFGGDERGRQSNCTDKSHWETKQLPAALCGQCHRDVLVSGLVCVEGT